MEQTKRKITPKVLVLRNEREFLPSPVVELVETGEGQGVRKKKAGGFLDCHTPLISTGSMTGVRNDELIDENHVDP
jgi:hypothetical protein